MSDSPAPDAVDTDALWDEMVDSLADSVPPEWTHFARSFADTPWMKAMLLLDAHDRLGGPSPTEHVSHTLHHLAESNGHALDAKGWETLHDKRREERRQLLILIEDKGPLVLDGEPAALFARSIVPLIRT